MAKKKDLGIFALVGGNYFSVRKMSTGLQKKGLELMKYDPVARKRVKVKITKTRRISSK